MRVSGQNAAAGGSLSHGDIIVLGVAYDGSGYHGWQRQATRSVPARPVNTLQETLEAALSRIAAAPVQVVCAGRTDAGVHASGQVVHFPAPRRRTLDNWLRGANSLLPGDLRVTWAELAGAGFHARYSAIERRYLYVIREGAVAPAGAASQVTREPRRLDDEAMHRAAQGLLGEHDFSSYRAADCQARTPFRALHRIEVRRFGHLVVVDVAANAFLKHMVRNVIGALLAVGRGEAPESWPARLLALRDRRRGNPTAPAAGVYLVDVRYPAEVLPPRPMTLPPLLSALEDIW